VQKLLATLDGLDTDYQYKNPLYCNCNSYSLVAISDLTSSNRVILWTQPDPRVSIVKLDVTDGSTPDLCDVTIALVSDGNRLNATWHEVPRQQVTFSRTLEHDENSGYNYEAHATGDYKAIGELLIITTDGMNAAVRNRTGDQVDPDGDLLAGASIFKAFATAPVAPSEKVTSPVGPVAATRFQEAYYEDLINHRIYLKNGSQLFAAMPGSLPNQGAVGIVQDTVGTASLVQQGVNGGWIESPAPRTLAFSGTNRVSFSIEEDNAPNIGKLTIAGDMSLELWCKPQRVRSGSTSPNKRLLTFNRNSEPNNFRYRCSVPGRFAGLPQPQVSESVQSRYRHLRSRRGRNERGHVLYLVLRGQCDGRSRRLHLHQAADRASPYCQSG
jgi:hypothetical protein